MQTVVFMALTLLISAPILIIGGIVMALRQDVPLSGLLVVILRDLIARRGFYAELYESQFSEALAEAV